MIEAPSNAAAAASPGLLEVDAQGLENRLVRVGEHVDPHAEGFYLAMGARRVGDAPSTPRGRTLLLLVLEVHRHSGTTFGRQAPRR